MRKADFLHSIILLSALIVAPALYVQGEEAPDQQAEQMEMLKGKLKALEGIWEERHPKWSQGYFQKYTVTVDGNRIKIRWSHAGDNTVDNFSGRYWFEGTADGQNITGTYYIDHTQWKGGRVFNYPFTGIINPDGSTITLRYTSINITGATGLVPDGWKEYKTEAVLKR